MIKKYYYFFSIAKFLDYQKFEEKSFKKSGNLDFEEKKQMETLETHHIVS